MTTVETSSQDDILTGASTTDTQESKATTSEPTEESKEKLPEGTKNWQHALQQAREREKASEEAAAEARKKVKEYENREKERKLEGMSEAEKYKALAEEEAQKRTKLELQIFVNQTIAGRDVPAPIVELLTETPWVIPPVYKELGDEFAWDDAIDAVKRYLPDYIDSLLVKGEVAPSEKEPIKRVDSERSYDVSAVSMGHVYTREEIARISADPKEWEKHREKILAQMSKSGGRISE